MANYGFPYLGVPDGVAATRVVVAGVDERRQLPGCDLPDLPDLAGGDLLAGTQAAVLRHQGGGGQPSSRHDDGVGACLDGAVMRPLMLEREALPALSSLPAGGTKLYLP